MSTLILSGKDVAGLLDMGQVLISVEQAFRDWASGRAQLPPKSYLEVEAGDFRAMPAAVPGAVGVKWVNVHPGNPARALPTVMAVLIYNDPATGYPLAIMDGTDITAYRTGAAAAIASKYLARKEAQTLGLFGAGRQAHTQLMAHAAIFTFKQIRVCDRSPAAIDRLIRAFPDYPIRQCPPEEVVASDILCTITPAREPVIRQEWVKPGTHINAIGADAAGKEELDPAILNRAIVVVDDIHQASAGGEINVPIARGLYRVEDVYGNLGEIIIGRKPGRTSADAVTVFDSTGIGIEDIAVARLIYEQARQRSGFLWLELIKS